MTTSGPRQFARRIRTKLTAPRNVTFCESCGQVCDAACRSDAVRDRARTAALWH